MQRNRFFPGLHLLVGTTMLVLLGVASIASQGIFTTLPSIVMAQSSVTLDFDAGSPPPNLYQSTPFNYVTLGGVIAQFGSPSDFPASPAFSVQSSQTTFWTLSLFSGQYLYPNNQNLRYALDIRFNQFLSFINFTFATIEYSGAPGVPASNITLTAYANSVGGTSVGTAIAHGVFSSDTWPQGTLQFSSGGQPFNLVQIVVPYQGPKAATGFLLDNILVTTTGQTADITPPVTTISLSGTAGNQGWHRSDVTVTLSANDDLSGVNNTEYSFDGTLWKRYTAALIVNAEGTTTIHYRSTDNVGNVETVRSQIVKEDKSLPVTTISLSGVPGSVLVTLSATDSISGVAKTEYSYDDVTWYVYAAPFSVSDPTKTTVYFRSTDIAGNTEAVKSRSLMQDTIPPATSISLSGVLGDQGWFTSDVQVTLSAIDDWFGVARTEYSFNNVTWTNYAASFTISNEGETTAYCRSTDVAGNVEAVKMQTVRIDKTAPTGSILINNGDVSTPSTSVTLTLTLNDAVSGIFEVRYSNDAVWDTEQWENPTPTKAWTLTPGNGLKIVYCQIKDNAGLVSATYQASITLGTIPSAVDTTKPEADAGQDRTGNVGTTMSFDASASRDDVGIVSYEWDFGDGTTSTGQTITHTYSVAGIYTVTLTVKDASGNIGTTSINVTMLSTSTTSLSQTSQLWIILIAVAIGIGAAIVLLLRRRK